MNKCIICGCEFKPKNGYIEQKTCSNGCLRIHLKNLTSEAFLENSFKKGHIPFNKGKAQTEWLSNDAIEKCSKTHIQNQKTIASEMSLAEGRYLPHNSKQRGTITKRKHIHKKGKYKGKVEWEYYINIDWKGNRKPNNLYRRFLWEYYHSQDIPNGYVVYAIDGNSDNLDISNLVLISRAELARKNRGGS